MAGRLTISTLNNDTGVLATQNGMTGIAKAWVNFNGYDASIRGSFNVSSVTRIATGRYTITFTTAMPNGNYSIHPASDQSPNADSQEVVSTQMNGLPPSTSSFGIISKRTIVGGSTMDIDRSYTFCAVFSA